MRFLGPVLVTLLAGAVVGVLFMDWGVTVERTGDNSYTLRLLWNDLALAWSDLTRTQIMTSSLSVILQALDTDLWHLLDQPMQPALAA